MERRKFLIGVGSTAIGASALVGSGAFSNATAQRDVTVDTTGDADALVGIRPISGTSIVNNEGDYAEITGETLEVNFDDLNEDADFTFEDVFVIENNGSRTVNLDRVNEDSWSYNDAGSPANVLVANDVNGFQQDVGRFTWTGGDGAELEPGQWIAIGFNFEGDGEVGNWGPDDIPETITFNLGG